MTNSQNIGFFDRVYEIVRSIPFGKVSTYGAIAKAAGSPQAARMVGWAMNNSYTVLPYVPAHRVVNRNGILTGKNYFGGQNTMKELLESENIKVTNDEIVQFQEHLWIPKVPENE